MRIALLLALLSAVNVLAVPSHVDVDRLEAKVKVDGDVSDAAWNKASKIENFVEYFRGDNTAPPVKTTGWIAYDEQAVYVAFLADDPRPGEIRAPLVDRDKVFDDQDYVSILIDTANDRRSAIAFRVNPRGIQTDSLVNDSTGDEDFSPDFFYEAVARRTPRGWSAELRIPLSSLRYPDADPQTWGVILTRNYPRDFRYVMANTPIPKNSGCFVCHEAILTGLADLPGGSHMTLTPYSTASSQRRGAAGFDLKWNPGTRLTIDATLNPDFSQIESDVPQIDENARFALSYPEKRTFFLEGVDLLSTPMRAVYTRSITAPAWGMRATGATDANAYTFLVAEDRGGGVTIVPGPEGSEAIPQERSHVAIGRLRHSFGDSFGALMLSTREYENGGHNRILGPDFLWRRSATDKIAGQFLVSDTDGKSGHAYRTYFQRDAPRYDLWMAASGYSPEFRADNGFIVQNGLRRYGIWGGLRNYPKGGLSYIRPYMGVEADTEFDGTRLLRRTLYDGVEFQGKWGSSGWIALGYNDESVQSRMLDRTTLEFNLRAAPSRWLPVIALDGEVGQKIDYAGVRVGDGGTINASGTMRATDHVELELRTSREWLDLDAGRLFTAHVDWLKMTYTFSARSLARLTAQRGDTTRNAALYPSPVSAHDRATTFSGLYGYKLNWQTVFFVGFGDAGETRSVFMKVAYAFQR